MPKALGLSEQCRKGTFPYRLASFDNEGKVWDSLPPISYYDTGNMRSGDRQKFEQWYAQNRMQKFNYDHEILSYCQKDVEILKMAILTFRQLFIQITTHPEKAKFGISPFSQAFTIAGACSRVFRQLFLEPNTIALLHKEMQLTHRKQSHKALKWLKYLNVKNDFQPPIQHALNGGEVRVGGKFCDGYREKEGVRYVFEFWGCFFHGHIMHLSPETYNPVSKCTMGQLHDETLARIKAFQKDGCVVQSIWECEFDKLMKEDLEAAAIVEKLQITPPLDARAALAGKSS